MKICMIEACKDKSSGSIGAWYVVEHARRAGFNVDILRRPRKGYDVELVSCHHQDDYPILAAMPKKARWRIVGGHSMQNNPRPVVPFADAVCIGEGETWIKNALPTLKKTGDIQSLAKLPGTIISQNHICGSSLPIANRESPLPDNPPYLNRPGTRSAAWYIEIARGCPYRCHYCELGHSLPYRRYSKEHIISVIDQADTSKTRKMNFYAPDEASHPDYNELYEYLNQRGYSASFSSMRLDSILRRGIPSIKQNHLIRIGVDGLTYETRLRVRKPIKDEMIIRYFTEFINRGHVQFKMFMIFGYPWETLDDFAGFESLMAKLMSIKLHKNISLRIKWTPFIPQPATPLANTEAQYDFNMVQKIDVWHAIYAKPRIEPGWWIEQDGLMGWKSWKRQCDLVKGDEMFLLKSNQNNVLHYPGGI